MAIAAALRDMKTKPRSRLKLRMPSRKPSERKAKDVKMKATITTGVLRGYSFIEIYYDRIIGLLRMNPVKGTLDLRLEKPIDMRRFSTKQLDHVLMHGYRKVDAYLAPIVLHLKEDDNEKDVRCWAIRQGISIYRDDILEVIAEENIKEKYGVKDGDVIEITMFQLPLKKGKELVKYRMEKLNKFRRG